jgi:Protein of unknown function (DUF2783)
MTAPTTSLSLTGLEQVYDSLAQALDDAGPEHTELFLTKLSLLMANALGDAALVQHLVKTALQDLSASKIAPRQELP